jgi:hypothetical protein
MSMHRNISSIVVLALCVGSLVGHAQVETVDAIRLVNTSNRNTVTLSEASTLTTNLMLTLPADIGVVGNYLGVGSIVGQNQFLNWQFAAASGVSSSDRAQTVTAGNTGVSVAASANKAYRVVGVLQMKRTVAASDDNIRIELAATGAEYTGFGVACANCPAATTGVPTFSSGTVSSFAVVNPEGVTDNKNYFAYSIDGLVVMGATSADITLTIDNNSEMNTHSYILITEIK